MVYCLIKCVDFVRLLLKSYFVSWTRRQMDGEVVHSREWPKYRYCTHTDCLANTWTTTKKKWASVRVILSWFKFALILAYWVYTFLRVNSPLVFYLKIHSYHIVDSSSKEGCRLWYVIWFECWYIRPVSLFYRKEKPEGFVSDFVMINK